MDSILDALNDEYDDNTVTFTDTDGEKHTCGFLDIVNYEGRQYAVFSPIPDDGYVMIFGYRSDGKKEYFTPESDDYVLDGVFEVFRLKNEDEFDFD